MVVIVYVGIFIFLVCSFSDWCCLVVVDASNESSVSSGDGDDDDDEKVMAESVSWL